MCLELHIAEIRNLCRFFSNYYKGIQFYFCLFRTTLARSDGSTTPLFYPHLVEFMYLYGMIFCFHFLCPAYQIYFLSSSILSSIAKCHHRSCMSTYIQTSADQKCNEVFFSLEFVMLGNRNIPVRPLGFDIALTTANASDEICLVSFKLIWLDFRQITL